MAQSMTVPPQMSSDDLLNQLMNMVHGSNKPIVQTIKFLIDVRGQKNVNKIFKEISQESGIAEQHVKTMNQAINSWNNLKLDRLGVLGKDELMRSKITNAWQDLQQQYKNPDNITPKGRITKGSYVINSIESELMNSMAGYSVLFDKEFPFEDFEFGKELSKWKPVNKNKMPSMELLTQWYKNNIPEFTEMASSLPTTLFKVLFSQMSETLDSDIDPSLISSFIQGAKNNDFANNLKEKKEILIDDIKQNLENQIQSLQFTEDELNIDKYFQKLTTNLSKEPMKARGTKSNTKTKLEKIIHGIEEEQNDLLQSLTIANEAQDQNKINEIALKYQRNQKAISRSKEMIQKWEEYPAKKAQEKADQETQIQNKIDTLKTSIQDLPNIDEIILADAEKITSIKKAYNAFTKRQKGLVPDDLVEKLFKSDEQIGLLKQQQADQERIRLQQEQEAIERERRKKDQEALAAQRAKEQELLRNIKQPQVPEPYSIFKELGINETDIVTQEQQEADVRERVADAAKEEAESVESANKAKEDFTPLSPGEVESLIGLSNIDQYISTDKENVFGKYGIQDVTGVDFDTALESLKIARDDLQHEIYEDGSFLNRATDLYNEIASSGNNPFEDDDFRNYATRYAIQDSELSLINNEIRKVRKQKRQRDNEIQARLSDITLDEESMSIDRADTSLTQNQAAATASVRGLTEAVKEQNQALDENAQKQKEDATATQQNTNSKKQQKNTAPSPPAPPAPPTPNKPNGNIPSGSVNSETNINNPTINIDTSSDGPDIEWINSLLKNADPLRQKELLSNPNSSVLYRTKPHQTMNVQYRADDQGNPIPIAASLTTDFKALASEMISIDAQIQKMTNDYQNLSNTEAQTQGPILLQRIQERRARQLELEGELTNYATSKDYALQRNARVVARDVQEAHDRTALDLSLKNQKKSDKEKNIEAYNDVRDAIEKVINATRTLQSLEDERRSGKNPFKDYKAEIAAARKELDQYNTDLKLAMQQYYGWQQSPTAQQLASEDTLTANQKKSLSSLFDKKDSAELSLDESRLGNLIPKWNELAKAVSNYTKALSDPKKSSDGDFMDGLIEKIKTAKKEFTNEWSNLQKEYPQLNTTLQNIMKTMNTEFSDNIQNGPLKDIEKNFVERFNAIKDSISGNTLGIQNVDNIHQQITQLIMDFQQGSISWEQFISSLQTENAKIIPLEGAVKDINSFQKQIDAVDTSVERTQAWYDKLVKIKQLQDDMFNNANNQPIYDSLKNQLEAEMQNFKTFSQQTIASTAKGFIFNEGQIQGNTVNEQMDSMRTHLIEYINLTKLGSIQTIQFSKDQKSLTATCKASAGEINTVTASLQEENKAMRVAINSSKGTNAFLTGFSGSIGKTIKSLPQLIMGYSAVMKLRSELTAGMNTFKEYDSTLTNISYTMNMTSKELDSLGKSAIDMAKDLSMSVANAEDVYKIYANMNTSAEEIQKLAKPTVILSNLSGVDASTAADEVQGIIQQFDMLKDAESDAADVSMHVVDVLNDISANVAMDYSFN